MSIIFMNRLWCACELWWLRRVVMLRGDEIILANARRCDFGSLPHLNIILDLRRPQNDSYILSGKLKSKIRKIRLRDDSSMVAPCDSRDWKLQANDCHVIPSPSNYEYLRKHSIVCNFNTKDFSVLKKKCGFVHSAIQVYVHRITRIKWNNEENGEEEEKERGKNDDILEKCFEF